MHAGRIVPLTQPPAPFSAADWSRAPARRLLRTGVRPINRANRLPQKAHSWLAPPWRNPSPFRPFRPNGAITCLQRCFTETAIRSIPSSASPASFVSNPTDFLPHQFISAPLQKFSSTMISLPALFLTTHLTKKFMQLVEGNKQPPYHFAFFNPYVRLPGKPHCPFLARRPAREYGQRGVCIVSMRPTLHATMEPSADLRGSRAESVHAPHLKTQIPARPVAGIRKHRTKRMVQLRWMSGSFSLGRRTV